MGETTGCDLSATNLTAGMLQAPLGTRLYERMQKEGRLVNEFSGDNVAGSTNIIPMMGWEHLREGYRKILEQIYAPQFYYWVYAASNAYNTGGSFSGPCSSVRVASHWQSRSQSTAFISARLPLCMLMECEGPNLWA